jgi:multidrug efflux pump subunit AcrB
MAAAAAAAATVTGGGGPGRIKINIGVDIQNNAELRANSHHVVASIRAARPKNTTRNYDPKQREFQVRVDDK